MHQVQGTRDTRQINEPMFHIHSLVILKKLTSRMHESVSHTEVMNMIREVSIASAVLQMLLFLLIMFTGTPGIYTKRRGLMYISNNLCHTRVLSTCFMLSTIPTWVILACSVSKEIIVYRRRCTLILISIPFPLGIGIVMFDWCSNPVIHYVYVTGFVIAIALVHIVVAKTARHVNFLQSYAFLLVGTAVCGISFLAVSMSETMPGIQRNVGVISEYLTTIGFILLNSLSTDRINEHIQF